jgi:ABC-type sugar transport system permease subunit
VENKEIAVEVEGAQESDSVALILPKPKTGKNKMKTWDKIFIVSILILPIAYFLVFWLYANLQSFAMAFQLPTGAWDTEFITWKSVFARFQDGELWGALRNTFLYFAKDLIFLPFHVIVAYFLFRRVPGYRIYQVALYIPAMISGVVYVTAFKEFLSADGPIGVLIQKCIDSPGAFGRWFSSKIPEIPEFFKNETYATPTILIYTIWLGWAGNMLLLGGSMARIPVEVLESARLDGVNIFQEIFIMIFPLLWNTLSTFIILQMTGVFGAGGPILLFMGNSAQDYGTTTLGYWIFIQIKYTGESAYNEVAATGLLLTAVGVPIILTIRKLIEKIPTVDY